MPNVFSWAGAIASIAFIATGCGFNTALPAPSQPIKPYHGPTLTNKQWGPVFQTPIRYVGAKIDVTGQVKEVVPGTHPPLSQIYLNPEKPSDPIAAYNVGKYKAGSYVRLKGVIRKIKTFHNTFAYPILAPVVEVTSIHRISRDAAVNPTVAQVSTPVAEHQHGLTLTVTKVQYAVSATRIFVTAVNHSGHAVTINDTGATLTQGQQSLLFHTGSPDVHSFPISIKNGRTAHSEMVFDKAQLGGTSIRLNIPVSSTNFNLSWHSFLYSFKVPKS